MAKILYFIDHLRPDGAQHFLLTLASGLADKHEQRVLCLNSRNDPQFVARFAEHGLTVDIIGFPALLSGLGLLRIAKIIRGYRPDVSLTLLFGGDVIGRIASRLAGVPRVVSSVRVRGTHYGQWQRKLLAATARLADQVILASAELEATTIAEEGVRSDQIQVISNSVDVDRFADIGNRAALARHYGLNPARPILGALGRLAPQKGYDVLLDAISQAENQDIQLLIAGRGAELSALQAQIERLGLGERVQLVGQISAVPEFLGGLDIYVHPSRYEGTPNSLMQAMASGRAVIATAVDGNLDLIVAGEHGLLVKPDSPSELAAGIDLLIAQSEQALQLGLRAQERMRKAFNPTVKLLSWERVLFPDTKGEKEDEA